MNAPCADGLGLTRSSDLAKSIAVAVRSEFIERNQLQHVGWAERPNGLVPVFRLVRDTEETP